MKKTLLLFFLRHQKLLDTTIIRHSSLVNQLLDLFNYELTATKKQ